jgi:hypothetical protein
MNSEIYKRFDTTLEEYLFFELGKEFSAYALEILSDYAISFNNMQVLIGDKRMDILKLHSDSLKKLVGLSGYKSIGNGEISKDSTLVSIFKAFLESIKARIKGQKLKVRGVALYIWCEDEVNEGLVQSIGDCISAIRLLGISDTINLITNQSSLLNEFQKRVNNNYAGNSLSVDEIHLEITDEEANYPLKNMENISSRVLKERIFQQLKKSFEELSLYKNLYTYPTYSLGVKVR